MFIWVIGSVLDGCNLARSDFESAIFGCMRQRVILGSDRLVTGRFNNDCFHYRVQTGLLSVKIQVACQSSSSCHRSNISSDFLGTNRVRALFFE